MCDLRINICSQSLIMSLSIVSIKKILTTCQIAANNATCLVNS